MLLPVEGVGLVEGDGVAAPGEVAQQAAVVSGGAVPIGRQQARAVEGDLHAVISRGAEAPSLAVTARSSAARCAQVWRARIVARPLSTRARRRSASSRRAARDLSISTSLFAMR